MGKVFDKGSVPRNGDKSNRGGTFGFDTERPARWTQAEDVRITGLFLNGYADNTVKVKSFDLVKNPPPSTRTFTASVPPKTPQAPGLRGFKNVAERGIRPRLPPFSFQCVADPFIAVRAPGGPDCRR